jgi:predicted O-methyltransferase YrrM
VALSQHYLCHKETGLELIHPLAEAYAENLTSRPDSLLEEIKEYTLTRHAESQMLSGHLQGKFLEMASCMIRPRRILEIGTFTGYSALSLAKGLTSDGLLHTIELREDDAARCRAYFDRSAYARQIILHTGNALNVIPGLEEEWDLVFIDADKPAYIEYFNLVFPRLRKNGYIFADNIFFHGEVLENPVKGKSAKGIKAFNEFIHSRQDVEKMVLTLRDGLFLLRKL